MGKENCTLFKGKELSPSHPLDRGGSEPQLMKSMEKWQTDIGLIPRERETIGLEYMELGKSREKLKWFMDISAINIKHCEIL